MKKPRASKRRHNKKVTLMSSRKQSQERRSVFVIQMDGAKPTYLRQTPNVNWFVFDKKDAQEFESNRTAWREVRRRGLSARDDIDVVETSRTKK